MRDDDDYRARLDAQTRRWRLVLGVGAWALAVALVVLLPLRHDGGVRAAAARGFDRDDAIAIAAGL